MLNSIPKNKVHITGGIFRERMNTDRDYLYELDSQCLLQNFYLEAGIIMPGLQVVPDPNSAKLHWGWESPTCQLRGHFLGHWLSAAAAFVASDNDTELKTKLDRIISELARCQKLNGGQWAGSIPEKYMDRLSGSEYIWSPQYTMHKTVMGLVDAYRFTGNEQALEIVDNLADWYIGWIERASKLDPDIAYKGEQGGMLEEWAELYDITKNEKYLTLIDAYKHNYMFTELENGSDVLSDNHANASIPISHGSARLYEVFGDEHYETLTRRFWEDAVTKRGMFATTGANAGEFWIPMHKMSQYISDTDQEFCTVYNMVRTADHLFRTTGDTAFADYIERAVYNGFLAQQNKHTGMPTYFLPLRAGAKKKWGSKRNDFWCCHGTMVQSPTLYPSLIYYTDEDCVTVAQYIPSEAELDLGGKEIKISQATDMLSYNNQVFFDEHSGGEKSRWSIRFEVECESGSRFALKLRIPCWCVGEPRVMIDGKAEGYEKQQGFIVIEREWAQKTVINIIFGSKVKAEPLDDEPALCALVDGPIVLAGLTDCDCGIEYSGDIESAISPRTEHTYSTYVWKQNCYVTKGQARNFELIPLYDVTDEQYTVYFTLKNTDK
ncbi:MAG: glycoside hydrolase family 127 protein [Ruminococcus sp.]|nr:glycoside hydrolase family 127 protein [Ruminococcus sp.]